MSAALIAAALTALASPAMAPTTAAVTTILPAPDARAAPPSSLPGLDRSSISSPCLGLTQKTADARGAKFKRLDQLPWGLVEHAVLRSVGGCPVREVVYQGQVYWVEPASPGRFDRVQPLTLQAAPTQK
jgi:hypothetical protein